MTNWREVSFMAYSEKSWITLPARLKKWDLTKKKGSEKN